MAPTLFVIGPSSVGKSSAASYAAAELGAHAIDSDDPLRHVPRPWGWSLVASVIHQAEQETEGFLILVIGAGAQADATGPLAEYLRARSGATLLMIAGPSEVHERNERAHRIGRSLPDFTRHEYWERADIYAAAGQLLDVSSMTEEETGKAFVALVRAVA
jgi:hypothetical protein